MRCASPPPCLPHHFQYDFFDETADNVGIARVAAGTPLARLPVSGCELSQFSGRPTKYGFVCINILDPEVRRASSTPLLGQRGRSGCRCWV